MPFRRRYKKRVSTNKAKRVVAKAQRRAAKSNKDTMAITCRNEATMLPVQGTTVANYIYTTIPLFAQDSGVGFYKNAQFQLYRKLYDQYRVNSVTVKVVPKANMLAQDSAQRDSELNTSGDGVIHSVIDRDGPAAMNVQTLVRYPSYRKHPVMKPFTRKYSIKYPTEVWLTTNEPYPDNLAIIKQIGGLGGIYIYGENLLEDKLEVFNEPFASIEIVFGIVFRGRISTGFGYDPETDTITLAPASATPLPTESQLVNLKGTILDTAVYTDFTNSDAKMAEVDVTQAQNVSD